MRDAQDGLLLAALKITILLVARMALSDTHRAPPDITINWTAMSRIAQDGHSDGCLNTVASNTQDDHSIGHPNGNVRGLQDQHSVPR